MMRNLEITTAEMGESVPARPRCGCENTEKTVHIVKCSQIKKRLESKRFGWGESKHPMRRHFWVPIVRLAYFCLVATCCPVAIFRDAQTIHRIPHMGCYPHEEWTLLHVLRVINGFSREQTGPGEEIN
jgi:hypothetical protein